MSRKQERFSGPSFQDPTASMEANMSFLCSSMTSQCLQQCRYVFYVLISEAYFISPHFCYQTLLLKVCRLYNVFCSGSSHGIYAQFIEQSTLANSGRAVGLLRGAGTRMALWFYALHRAPRLKRPLVATVSQHKFQEIQHADCAGLAVSDIQDPGFWNQIYLLTRAVFPCLKVLRFCDKSEPSMDKII
jgi:hypothetical protein